MRSMNIPIQSEKMRKYTKIMRLSITRLLNRLSSYVNCGISCENITIKLDSEENQIGYENLGQ